MSNPHKIAYYWRLLIRKLVGCWNRLWRMHYFSTACYHDLHSECRHACKFCDAPCRCLCHPIKADIHE
jgi:hypothetical protein